MPIRKSDEVKTAISIRERGIGFVRTMARRLREHVIASWRTARTHHRLNQAIQALDEALTEAVLERNHRFVALGQTLHQWLKDNETDHPMLMRFVNTIDELSATIEGASQDRDLAAKESTRAEGELRAVEQEWNEKLALLEDEKRLIKNEWTHCARELKHIQKDDRFTHGPADAGASSHRLAHGLRDLADKVADLESRLAVIDGELIEGRRESGLVLSQLNQRYDAAERALRSAEKQVETLRKRHRATFVDLARESLVSPEALVSELLTDRARAGVQDVEKVREERRLLVEQRDALDPLPYRILVGLLAILLFGLVWALIF